MLGREENLWKAFLMLGFSEDQFFGRNVWGMGIFRRVWLFSYIQKVVLMYF